MASWSSLFVSSDQERSSPPDDIVLQHTAAKMAGLNLDLPDQHGAVRSARDSSGSAKTNKANPLNTSSTEEFPPIQESSQSSTHDKPKPTETSAQRSGLRRKPAWMISLEEKRAQLAAEGSGAVRDKIKFKISSKMAMWQIWTKPNFIIYCTLLFCQAKGPILSAPPSPPPAAPRASASASKNPKKAEANAQRRGDAFADSMAARFKTMDKKPPHKDAFPAVSQAYANNTSKSNTKSSSNENANTNTTPQDKNPAIRPTPKVPGRNWKIKQNNN